MPIWLRNFTFTRLKEYYEKQNEAAQPTPTSSNKALGPNIQPSYNTKASK